MINTHIKINSPVWNNSFGFGIFRNWFDTTYTYAYVEFKDSTIRIISIKLLIEVEKNDIIK